MDNYEIKESHNSTRSTAIDMIRVMAIFFVLYNHKDTYTWYTRCTSNIPVFFVTSSLAILCKCGPPLFLMISGILLLPKEESISFLLKHRLSRMFVVLIWMATSTRFFKMTDNWFYAFFSGVNWYIYCYIGYLIMLPLLRKLVQTKAPNLELYYMVMVAICYTTAGIMPLIGFQGGLLSYIPIITTEWAPLCWNLVYPICAVFLLRTIDYMRNRKVLFFLFIGTLLSLVVGSGLLYHNVLRGGGYSEHLIQHFALIPCALIFYTFLYLRDQMDHYARIHPYIQRLISTMAANSFGVYIIEISTPLSPIVINSFFYRNGLSFGRCIQAVVFELLLYNIIVFLLRKIAVLKPILG